MRLAVLVDTYPRWSERFVAREVGALREAGLAVSIFAFRRGVGPGADSGGAAAGVEALAPAEAETLPPPLSWTSLELAWRRPPAAAREAWRALQAEGGWRDRVRAARALALARLLRAGRFTHLHAHFANWPSTVAWLAALETGLPFTFACHARDLFVEASFLEEKARLAKAVFACHAAGLEFLRRTAGEKAVLLRHGLPLEEYPFREPEPRRGRREILLAGRLVEKKGGPDLLAALARPGWTGPEWRLTIAGAGPELPAWRAECARLGLAGQVRWLPPQSGSGLRDLMRASDLFAAPSRAAPAGDRDGIPNAVLEALALGLPVAGTDAGGLPEILDEETGWVARAGAPGELAGVLANALQDAPAALRKARAGRARVEERHDLRKCVLPFRAALE